MPASKSVTELTQVAARAAAEKFGTEMIAIDLSDQMVLSEVFLIITGANIRQVDAIADEVEETEDLLELKMKEINKEVSEKVWFLNRCRGRIGSTARFSHIRKRTVSNNPRPKDAIVRVSVHPS